MVAAAALLVVGSTVVWAQTKAGGAGNATSRPAFNVASVKPSKAGPCLENADQPGGYVRITGCPLRNLLGRAYRLVPAQNQLTVGVPAWGDSEHFDIEARAEGNLDRKQRALRLQSLLEDRFKLAAHMETRQLRVFVMTVAKPGKLGAGLVLHSDDTPCVGFTPGQAANPDGKTPGFCGGFRMTAGTTPGSLRQIGNKVSMDDFATLLSGTVGDRMVINRTGLTGDFDTIVDFAPVQVSAPPADTSAPSIFTALQEQLGLRLDLETVPVDILVVDHVEEPTAN